jgi:hypothetical protein
MTNPLAPAPGAYRVYQQHPSGLQCSEERPCPTNIMIPGPAPLIPGSLAQALRDGSSTSSSSLVSGKGVVN